MARSKRRKNGFEPTQAYTVDRLKKALRLYERSKSHIERRGLPHSFLGSYLRSSYYDLRIRQSNLEPIDIDCDDDSDGNYSPKSRKKRKRNNAKPAELSLPEQVQPQKLVIIFRLKSIAAKTVLHKLAHSAIFSDLVEDFDDTEEEKKVSQAQKKPPASVRSIRTAYCHPLDCELGNNNGEPCEFCRNFTFGMFGLGLKEVRVADYGRGYGLEEVEGGHQSAGHERTRICHNCCLDRQYITNCPGHKLSPLPGLDPLTFDFGKAFRSLEKQNGGYKQVSQWCSLCLNPAFFRCSTELFVDKFARDIEDPSSLEVSGCGLLLCDGCKVLVEIHVNDLARVVSSIPASEGVRADVDFLLPGSSLHRYFWE